jgi:hypothetical protein
VKKSYFSGRKNVKILQKEKQKKHNGCFHGSQCFFLGENYFIFFRVENYDFDTLGRIFCGGEKGRNSPDFEK